MNIQIRMINIQTMSPHEYFELKKPRCNGYFEYS